MSFKERLKPMTFSHHSAQLCLGTFNTNSEDEASDKTPFAKAPRLPSHSSGFVLWVTPSPHESPGVPGCLLQPKAPLTQPTQPKGPLGLGSTPVHSEMVLPHSGPLLAVTWNQELSPQRG